MTLLNVSLALTKNMVVLMSPEISVAGLILTDLKDEITYLFVIVRK